jgi:Plant transposon protein
MRTLEELEINNAEYVAAGFPWALFSAECVLGRVWGVLKNLKQVPTGKEKFPSRVFEVSVNRRSIMTSATMGFYGSVVDQSIVKFDGAMTALRDGYYKDFRYSVYDKDGKRTVFSGAYALSDNGYHPWPSLMYPSKDAQSVADRDWREMSESLRKDIECLFGQLKQEFAILKYGSRFNSLELMDEIFLTCCAIHNQRKIIAGLDAPWCTEIIEGDDSDLSQKEAAVFRRMHEEDRNLSMRGGGVGSGEHVVVHDNCTEKYFDKHFKVANRKGEVVWPRIDGFVRNYYAASQR